MIIQKIRSACSNRKFFAYIIWILLIALSAGCSDSPTPELPEVAVTENPQFSTLPPTCLEGIWEINDKESFLRSLVPVGAFELDQLSKPETIGSVAYRFDNQGNLTVEAVNFQGHYDVKTDGDLQSLDFRMNGFANARYLAENGSLSISEMTASDMDFSAKYSGEEMMLDVKANGYLPLFVDAYRAAEYECSDNQLALSITNFPNIQTPLLFKRLR